MKPIIRLGDSLQRLRTASAGIRYDASHELNSVQCGDSPRDFKPMSDVGPGTMEIRVHRENEFRVFYVARFEEAVYVLHCFAKKSQTTPKADIERAKSDTLRCLKQGD
ncbi:MAG: type II toxin-antitoxin system RelE/ParE family toxin [Bryobacteraceae bacterium]